MSDIDGLWLNCCRNPQDFLARGVLADRLQELGAEVLAESIRGPEGKVFALSAAEPPDGHLILRLQGMTNDEQVEAAKDIIRENLDHIIESDNFNSAMAITNACEWTVDDFDVESPVLSIDSYSVRITFYASGSQIEDKMHYGTEIRGDAVVTLAPDGSIEIDVESADVEHDGPDGLDGPEGPDTEEDLVQRKLDS